MKISRLETLYKQKLVSPNDVSGKKFPLDELLKKTLHFHPHAQNNGQYDILEIGPGRGDFLFSLCEENPHKKIVAVELGKSRFDKLKLNSEKKHIQNLTLIYGDARIPVETHFAEASFEHVYVLFPDPWPRNKHRHKRLLQTDFLKKLSLKMKPQGEFLLVTDVFDYAQWAYDNFLKLPEFSSKIQQSGPVLGAPTSFTQTFFAEKWKKMGREFWHIRFEKN